MWAIRFFRHIHTRFTGKSVFFFLRIICEYEFQRTQRITFLIVPYIIVNKLYYYNEFRYKKKKKTESVVIEILC